MYNILQSSSIPGLVEVVNKSLADKYKPIGGVATDAGYFYQAVYKEENMVNAVMQPQKQEHDKYGKNTKR
jgi:hypothetical protein